MTACECPESGYCPRHQCVKTEHWHRLCRTRADYFQLWEAGRGPGQAISGVVSPAGYVRCRYQREELRKQRCPSCCGSVRLKVFGCTVHTECTLAWPFIGIDCCQTCESYDPLETLTLSEYDEQHHEPSRALPHAAMTN